MATYFRKEKIGSGGFGEVWRCIRKEDGRVLAMKRLEATDDQARKRFQREVRIVSSLDHPNIIRIVGKRLEDPPYFYVMPLYAKSLRDEISGIVGNEEDIFKIASSILNGLEYSHS